MNGFHVYGGSAGMRFERLVNRSGEPVLSIDAAVRTGEQFDWANKVVIQITPREHPALMCTVLGLMAEFEANNHGPSKDKLFRLSNQPERGQMYARLQQGQQSFHVPIPPDKVFHLGALGLHILAEQVGMDTPSCLALLRATAGRLLVSR